MKDFNDAGALPKNINLINFKAETLESHRASWHKSCRVKYSSSMLKRVQGRKIKSSEVHNEDGSSDPKNNLFTANVNSSYVDNLLTCFFCDEILDPTDKYTRYARAFNTDKKVRKCATDVGITKLLTKLAAGDIVAIDAVYHVNCLTPLYKRHSCFLDSSNENNTKKDVHGIVFAELVSYIKEAKYDPDVRVFKMADLVKLYSKKLEAFDVYK